jgi:hypothetical protein
MVIEEVDRPEYGQEKISKKPAAHLPRKEDFSS